MIKRPAQFLIVLVSHIFVVSLIMGNVIENNGEETICVTGIQGKVASIDSKKTNNGRDHLGLPDNLVTSAYHSAYPLRNYATVIKNITKSKEKSTYWNAVPLSSSGTIGGIDSISEPADRLVCTYYFYWYDALYGAGNNVMTDHPPDAFLSTFSFREVSWHKREILDMISAGIDIMLPVYLGDDVNRQNWSVVGLEKIVAAQEELIAEGYNPPKVGLFFDTTALKYQNNGQLVDLTQDYGKVLFYNMIRDFYSIVPAQLRAKIDGKPIIWLYSATYASAYDQETFNYIYNHFKSDFNGINPYIVTDATWQGVVTDNSYCWGSALIGPMITGIASVGPGFNNTGYIPSTGGKPSIRERDNGIFYRDSWQAILGSGSRNVVLETWNELGEATEICNSREYGRKYIENTRNYVNLFKALPDYKSESMVWWGLDVNQHPIQKGLITKKRMESNLCRRVGKRQSMPKTRLIPTHITFILM